MDGLLVVRDESCNMRTHSRSKEDAMCVRLTADKASKNIIMDSLICENTQLLVLIIQCPGKGFRIVP